MRAAAALLTVGVATLAVTAASAGASAGTGVSVRVEGPKRTLLAATSVKTTAAAIVRDGNIADSCPGTSALGALEDATNGNWNGTWSKSYKDYLITSIEGLDYPSSGIWYWSFWRNDKPASAGACAVTVKPGDSVLFFPGCYGKGCPKLAPSVLGVVAPTSVVTGQTFALRVSEYSNAAGKQSPGAGVKVAGGGASARTAANGVARIALRHAGEVTLKLSAPNTIRTEATVCVHAPGSACK
jgi:hypothetical protein